MGQPGVYIRNAKFALLRKLRKRSEFASLRFAENSRAFASLSLRFRFAFASLFEGTNSPKSENFRRILAFLCKNSFERARVRRARSAKGIPPVLIFIMNFIFFARILILLVLETWDHGEIETWLCTRVDTLKIFREILIF